MTIISSWKQALIECGVNAEHITEDLVSVLQHYRFTPDTFSEESFRGYHYGESINDVSVALAKEFASLNALQEFLESAIDWSKAWQEVAKQEGWLLLQMDSSTWGLFHEENK